MRTGVFVKSILFCIISAVCVKARIYTATKGSASVVMIIGNNWTGTKIVEDQADFFVSMRFANLKSECRRWLSVSHSISMYEVP